MKDATLNVLNARLRARCALFPLKNKKILEVRPNDLYFWRDAKILMKMCIVQHAQTKSVFTFQPTKNPVSTIKKSAKPVLTFWIFLLRTKNWQLCCLLLMVHIDLQEKWVATMKNEINLLFWRNCSTNHNQAHPKLYQKQRQKSLLLWHIPVESPLDHAVNQNFFSVLILYTFSLQWSNMISSVSDNCIEWSFDFWKDSVILIVGDFVQEMTISVREIPFAAWSLLLSQREAILNSHLARVSFTPSKKLQWRCGMMYSLV